MSTASAAPRQDVPLNRRRGFWSEIGTEFGPRTCRGERARAAPEWKRPLRPGAPRPNFPTPRLSSGPLPSRSPGDLGAEARSEERGSPALCPPWRGRGEASAPSRQEIMTARAPPLAPAPPGAPGPQAEPAGLPAPRGPAAPPPRPALRPAAPGPRPLRAASLTRAELEAAVAAAAPQRALALLQDVVVLGLEELHAGPGRRGRQKRRPGAPWSLRPRAPGGGDPRGARGAS